MISEEQEDILFEHFHLDVDSGQEPVRVDKYMSTHLEKTSRNRIQMAIKNGYVKVGEKTVKANYVVRPGEVIRFVMPYERRGVDVIPQDIPLNIIYEDSSLLVLNKAAGMVVHPGHGHYDGTLVNALAWHLGVRVAGDDERGGFLVHRIDKDTSGLLVISKTDEAQMSLADQFYRHTIDRRYQAIVWATCLRTTAPWTRLWREIRPKGPDTVSPGKTARANAPSLTGRYWNASASSPWWNASWKPAARTRFECTWLRLAIPSSMTKNTAVPKSAREPSTPSTASSSKTASRFARVRLCTPRPWDSRTR